MTGSGQFCYDFHIHSCLSPCGDADMTPNNMVNMAKLNGLDAIAITDHNTCKNCGAAVKAGERAGLLVIPGMELCTREEIHVICLFPDVERAESFAGFIYDRLPGIPNRSDIFGDQLVLDDMDRVTGSEEKMLLNAVDIGVDSVKALVSEYDGAAFPAHIDKESYSILGVLGSIPPETGFFCAELSTLCERERFLADHPELSEFRFVVNSDAHYLWQISEREHSMSGEVSAGAILLSMNRQKIL
ncbi:MAG TPA: PHP domain-containing protein [Clostridia bacterium]|nr:PHP domain-containing protein [Clostridia bacterium]